MALILVYPPLVPAELQGRLPSEHSALGLGLLIGQDPHVLTSLKLHNELVIPGRLNRFKDGPGLDLRIGNVHKCPHSLYKELMSYRYTVNKAPMVDLTSQYMLGHGHGLTFLK